MKLNIGCEDITVEGYVGLDINGPDRAKAVQVQADALALPFADDSIEEIFASHVLEHMEWDQDPMVEWARVLKPGGLITVAFPDVFEMLMLVYEGTCSRYWFNCAVFGGIKISADQHEDVTEEQAESYHHEGHVHNQALTGPMVVEQMRPFFPDAAMTFAFHIRPRYGGEAVVWGHKPDGDSDGGPEAVGDSP